MSSDETPPPPPPPPLPRLQKSPDATRQTVIGISAIVFGIGGVLVALYPIIAALFGSLGTGSSMWDERRSGAILWLLLVTVPIGGVIALFGLVCLIMWMVLEQNSSTARKFH